MTTHPTPDPHAPGRERLSALADGELDARACADVCTAWRDDDQARRQWHEWHLIGDVLRSDDLAVPSARDLQFLAGLRARLASEPVVLAPVPTRREGGGSAFLHWRRSGAVAAGLALVVGTVVVLRNGGDAGPPAATVAVADSNVLSSVAAPNPDRPRAIAVGATTLDRQMIRDARLDRYLEAHKQFAGSSALGVPSAFLSGATVDTAAR